MQPEQLSQLLSFVTALQPKARRGKGMAKKSLIQNDQVIAGIMLVSLVGLFQMHTLMSSHIKDCAERSATVAKIGVGIFVLVAGGLILSAITAYGHGATIPH